MQPDLVAHADWSKGCEEAVAPAEHLSRPSPVIEHRYDDGVTMVLRLPDEVAALLEKRASQRGLTVTQLVSKMAQPPRDWRALESFIGCADIAVDAPFDIHQGRADTADEFLRDLDDRTTSPAQRSSRSAGRSLDID